MMNKTIFLLFIFVLLSSLLYTQDSFPGINYSAVYRNSSGEIEPNVNMSVKIQIKTESESLIIWEEEHSTFSDGYGYFHCIIGEGVSTGNGLVTDFSFINWGAMTYIISIEIDDGNGYVEFGDNNLYSVPYALYAKVAENQLFLNNLVDVDTTGILENSILKWDGFNWIIASQNDTVQYSEFSLNSLNSIYSDTATYAINMLCEPVVDSAQFSFYSDSANFAYTSINSINAEYSFLADSANFAFSGKDLWLLGGNILADENASLGSIDSNDIVIITHQEERMRIKANGKIGIGTSEPIADFHIFEKNGFMVEGQFGSGLFPIEDEGTRLMWVPKKSAFRVGQVTGNAWNEFNVGNYSFSGGYNSKASGEYSFSYGQNSTASGDHAVSMGYLTTASGNTSVALGNASGASGYSSIALGRGAGASDSASFAIGYTVQSHGKAAGAFGFQSIANGDYSMVFGYRAKADHDGCFVFADASNYANGSAYTTTTANNQFLVKASGGTYFYTDSDQLSGVYLAAGSGSWSSLSDKNSKENIEEINYSEILERLMSIDVYSWNYISQDDDIRHIGPYAQDIYKQFNYGESDEAISIVDMDGINLASIKALLIKLEDLKLSVEENEMYKVKYMLLLKSFILLDERISSLESISAE